MDGISFMAEKRRVTGEIRSGCKVIYISGKSHIVMLEPRNHAIIPPELGTSSGDEIRIERPEARGRASSAARLSANIVVEYAILNLC